MKKNIALFFLLLILCSMSLSPRVSFASEAPACKGMIALGAPAVEIVCALGMGKELVARSSWDRFPPAIRSLPDVGTPFQPSIERILSLAPERILTDGRFGRLKERLVPLGVEVVTVNAYNPDEVLPAVKNLAALLGQGERGSLLSAELLSLREEVKEKLAGVRPEEKPHGVMLTGFGECYCVAPASGCSLLEDAGAVDLASDLGHPFPLISKEWLADMAPDFILVPVKDEEIEKSQQAAWTSEMEALLPGKSRILFMEEGLTFGLRSFLGMLQLAAELYPERFSQEDIARRKRMFLEMFFSADSQRD